MPSQSFTASQAAVQITRNLGAWVPSLGTPIDLTYAYRSTAPASYPTAGMNGFTRFTADEIGVAEVALQKWSDVANITFTRVGTGTTGEGAYSNSAQFLLANFTGNATAVSTFDGFGSRNFTINSGVYDRHAQVWLDGTQNYIIAPVFPNAAWRLIEHEVGHAIGLSHPGNYDASLGTSSYAADAVYIEDSLQYTVMSYFSETETGANFGRQRPLTPMLHDIAAAQRIYGADMTTRTGDTVYGFNSTTGDQIYTFVTAASERVFCIWDAGGNDTINASGYSLPSLINLNPGTFSSMGSLSGSATERMTSNISIAFGAIIENAIGGSGNDTLIGNSVANLLYGGAGDDTAVFAGNLSSYTPQDLGGGKIAISGPEGNDSLLSIEYLRFADGTINYNDGSGVFDSIFYDRTYLDVFHAGVDARTHYNASGWQEARDPNAFFSTGFYLSTNPDVRASGVNPLEQYHQQGWREGRDPAPNFDTKLYLIHNPDVAAAGIDPLEHYLLNGFAEGRAIYAAVGSTVIDGFDAQYYLLHNPDVAAAGLNPLTHFNAYGWHEGRNPNAYFDTAGYLAHYTDVAAAGLNPLVHYEAYGWHEGRDPSAIFDTQGYLAANPDVAAAHINPLDHYLRDGIYEGRMAVNDGVWG